MLTLKNTLETDVLVVGGGIGGLCAAISAAQGGAKVIVLEKANSKRSGSGATGNDHFTCYYPKAHGDDIAPHPEGTSGRRARPLPRHQAFGALP